MAGHSFIPPDRVFAKIERTLKTKEVIVSPLEYIEVLQKNGTCVNLTTIPVYDWKAFLTRTKTENILVQGE